MTPAGDKRVSRHRPLWPLSWVGGHLRPYSPTSHGGEEKGQGLLSSGNFNLPKESGGVLTFTPKPPWKEMVKGSSGNQQHLSPLSPPSLNLSTLCNLGGFLGWRIGRGAI